MYIYVAIDLNEKEKKFLLDGVGVADVIFPDELSDFKKMEAFKSADICFGNVPSEWLKSPNNLSWMQLESVGFGEYQMLNLPSELTITNLKGFFDKPVAESALAGILSFYRGIEQFYNLKQQKKWSGASLRPSLSILRNTEVLIMGGGSIGQRLKKLLTAFEAKITIFDKYLPIAEIHDIEELDKVINTFEIVISCLPETKETIGILNKSRLNSMNEKAILVNVGRGSVIDQQALVVLLKNNKLRGCILDVTQEEPIEQIDPIWDCPNTILTQHTGGGYENEIIDKIKLFLENLQLFLKNQPLKNIIDIKKGY